MAASCKDRPDADQPGWVRAGPSMKELMRNFDMTREWEGTLVDLRFPKRYVCPRWMLARAGASALYAGQALLAVRRQRRRGLRRGRHKWLAGEGHGGQHFRLRHQPCALGHLPLLQAPRARSPRLVRDPAPVQLPRRPLSDPRWPARRADMGPVTDPGRLQVAKVRRQSGGGFE